MSTRCILLDKIFYADYGTNESWYVLSLFHEVNHNWKDFAGCYEWFITTSLLLWDKLTWHGTIKRKTAVTGLGNGKKITHDDYLECVGRHQSSCQYVWACERDHFRFLFHQSQCFPSHRITFSKDLSHIERLSLLSRSLSLDKNDVFIKYPSGFFPRKDTGNRK